MRKQKARASKQLIIAKLSSYSVAFRSYQILPSWPRVLAFFRAVPLAMVSMATHCASMYKDALVPIGAPRRGFVKQPTGPTLLAGIAST